MDLKLTSPYRALSILFPREIWISNKICLGSALHLALYKAVNNAPFRTLIMLETNPKSVMAMLNEYDLSLVTNWMAKNRGLPALSHTVLETLRDEYIENRWKSTLFAARWVGENSPGNRFASLAKDYLKLDTISSDRLPYFGSVESRGKKNAWVRAVKKVLSL